MFEVNLRNTAGPQIELYFLNLEFPARELISLRPIDGGRLVFHRRLKKLPFSQGNCSF